MEEPNTDQKRQEGRRSTYRPSTLRTEIVYVGGPLDGQFRPAPWSRSPRFVRTDGGKITGQQGMQILGGTEINGRPRRHDTCYVLAAKDGQKLYLYSDLWMTYERDLEDWPDE